MGDEFPKHLLKTGHEPQVDHINNRCRFPLMRKLEAVFPTEYNEVKKNSVFANILSIKENGLGYSARLIHSMMCRQLVTEKKYEVWCVFGGRPLRFSLQEFHAITGLKHEDDHVSTELDDMEDDDGFWSSLLKKKENISIKTLLDNHLVNAKKWRFVDKLRFVYICVIMGVVVAKDEKAHIPHKYVKLVMDFELVESFPWGRDAFNCLITSIIETRGKLKNKSYTLDGFSYAFQIWIMEAIPIIGKLLASKISEEVFECRCTNWSGLARVSYADIIQLEGTIKSDDSVFSYISSNGNVDIINSIEFFWPDEVCDDGVNNLKHAISLGNEFGPNMWESFEDGETIEI